MLINQVLITYIYLISHNEQSLQSDLSKGNQSMKQLHG